jgi:hypothetical protein
MRRGFGLVGFAAVLVLVTSIALLGQVVPGDVERAGEVGGGSDGAPRRNVVGADGAIAVEYGVLGAVGSPDAAARAGADTGSNTGLPADARHGGAGELPGEVKSFLPGREELQALAEAYPDRVEGLRVRNGQWALRMDGTWYHWAEGRLLPEEHLDRSDAFASLRFYSNYELGPPRQRTVPPELAERLRGIMESEERRERSRFNAFNDALYGVSSRVEAEQLMEWMDFLGRRTRVHPIVVEPLKRVDRRIMEAAADDPETAEFVEELFQIHGYNWRNIAGTGRRSYHAYGIAVDLLPIRWHGGWAYWQWAYDSGIEEWWNLPLSDRWRIPQPVIDAFEAEGFIWGGKWLFFDNMHFEYRPESLALIRESAR